MTTKKKAVQAPAKPANTTTKKYGFGGEQAAKHATADSKNLKLVMGNNIVALCDTGYVLRRVHWMPTGEVNKDGKSIPEPVVCGVHTTGDDEAISEAFSAPEDCLICARVDEIYQSTKDAKDDPINKHLRDKAKEIRAGHEFEFIVTKGVGDTKRANGKVIITPFFEKIEPAILSVSKNTFKYFHNAWKINGLEEDDALGLPVNFYKERLDKKIFDEVTSCELFPKHKLKAADLEGLTLPEYGSTEYDQKKAQQSLDIFESTLSSRSSRPAAPKAKGKK